MAQAAKLTIDATPISLPSDSNDAWKIDGLVLRICWRGDRTRLQREALILEHLPDEVPHVRLAAAGVNDDLTWMLTHWAPGTMLSYGWADLDRTQQWACTGLTDIHHQGRGPGEDAHHGDRGTEEEPSASVVHTGVQG